MLNVGSWQALPKSGRQAWPRSLLVIKTSTACLYLFKLALHGPWSSCVRRSTGLAFGLAATLFSCYLIYEANIELLVVACTIFVIGFPIYLWARRKEQVFTKSEACLAVIIVIAAIVGICSMVGLI